MLPTPACLLLASARKYAPMVSGAGASGRLQGHTEAGNCRRQRRYTTVGMCVPIASLKPALPGG
eukprot:4216249-Alexandrium_andersonii.AAC.1